MLTGLASASAGVACGGKRATAPMQVQFVGQDPERAHKLRDKALAGPGGGRGETIRTRVLIVGGGAAGMAAAWRLSRAGMTDVVVTELEDGLGGTARGGVAPRSAYPMGAHYLPSPHRSNRGLWTLLRELSFVVGEHDGTPELDARFICRAPVERHKYEGLWSPGLYPARGQTPDEEAQWERWRGYLRALDGRIGADGRRLFDLPVDRSSTELRHLDAISAAEHLDALGLTSPRLRWTMDYACRDDYGCTLSQASAFALLHHELSRGLEDTHDRFILTFPEGNARLVSSMAAAAGVTDSVRRSTVVHRIDPDLGVADAWDFEQARPLRIVAEVILWAAPRFVLRHVLPAGVDPLPPGSMHYVPWLVANVQVRQAPGGVGALPAWDNVPVDADHLGYVRADHGEPMTEQRDPGGVLTFYQPLPADDAAGLVAERTRLLSTSLPAWGEHVVAALTGMHPGIAEDIEQIDIARWGHGMVRAGPGWLFGGARQTAATPIGTVVPCAADVGGLPLFEEAYAGGVRGAELALSRLGQPEPTLL
ncbi:MAG: NAD(P)-binding protein [Myxococcota bacterium]